MKNSTTGPGAGRLGPVTAATAALVQMGDFQKQSWARVGGMMWDVFLAKGAGV
jgi:hypothetical protein